MLLFYMISNWCAGPDLNRHGRNGRAILSVWRPDTLGGEIGSDLFLLLILLHLQRGSVRS